MRGIRDGPKGSSRFAGRSSTSAAWRKTTRGSSPSTCSTACARRIPIAGRAPARNWCSMVSGTAPPPPATDIAHRHYAAWRCSRRNSPGQRVTLVGQFRGRNLFGDLPESPISDKWEYVIRSADAAVWVMGLQPKGKGFNFDATSARFRALGEDFWHGAHRQGARVDRRHEHRTRAGAGGGSRHRGCRSAAARYPVEVLFSAPTQGETDVRSIRAFAFSSPATWTSASLKDHVRISYSASESKERGEANRLQ